MFPAAGGWRVRAALLALGLLASGRHAPAQTQALKAAPDALAERVEVEVVNVDVVVSDRDQGWVLDLNQDDFELLVDGKPVPIDYFAPPRGGNPSSAAVARAPSGPSAGGDAAAPANAESAALVPANLILYVDQTALESRARQITLDELRQFLRRRPAGAERVMVAAFEQNLRVLLLPTTDRARIAQALDQLEKLPARARLGSSERLQLERNVRSYGRAAMGVDAGRGAAYLRAEAQRLEQEISAWAEQEVDRERRAVAALARLVSALAAVEGRKAVVLATAGITANPALFLRSALDQQRRGLTSADSNRTPTLELLGEMLLVEFEQMVHAAQNARVAFYTVSPGAVPQAQNSAEFGSTGPGSDRPLPRDLSVVEASTSITRMAAATGGASFTIGSGLGRRLERVTAEADAAYSLGFTTGAQAGAADHRIEVRTVRTDLEVRHRESFRRRSAPERAETALSAAVTFGQAENPLGISLEVGPGTPGLKRRSGQVVPIAVGIPLRLLALLPVGDERHGAISVRVAIQDAHGRLLEGGIATLPIVVAENQLAKALVSSWYYRAEMRLAPGTQRVAVVVLDEVAGVQSTQFAEIAIPDPK